jgi:hypothetical protein
VFLSICVVFVVIFGIRSRKTIIRR